MDGYRSTSFESHYILLGKGIVLIERLDLNCISPGKYDIIAFPLKIKDGNGSPARVMLIEK